MVLPLAEKSFVGAATDNYSWVLIAHLRETCALIKVAAAPAREPINTRWYIPAALLLMLIGTPWMWPSGEEGPVFAGLPVWVWVTIGASFSLSVLTAFGAIRLWGDDDEAE